MATNGKGRVFKPYTYYSFRFYDPILDKTLALMDDMVSSGRYKSHAAIAKDANVSESTPRNWKRNAKRRVRRPQFSSVAAIWATAGRKTIDIS